MWVKTQSGGLHCLFKLGEHDPGCNAGVVHDGVDLRGGGGYLAVGFRSSGVVETEYLDDE